MLRKFKWALVALTTLVFSNQIFAGSLILNTGYDYPNNNIYSTTPSVNDDYWIRIAVGGGSPLISSPLPGPSWAVVGGWTSAMSYTISSSSFPSTWINAFNNNNLSPTGASWQNPAYAIYRKCFCLPNGSVEPRIIAQVRNDDSIQIWLNLMTNQLLAPNVRPYNGFAPPYTLNSNPAFFRPGINCLYVQVEDTGGATGFNLIGEVRTIGPAPLVAQGVNMSFAPCACQTRGVNPQIKFDVEEQAMIKQIAKTAELKRLELKKQSVPMDLKQ